MTHRKELLENAITHTCGDRDAEYGSPQENLSNCARLWEAYLTSKYPVTFSLTAEDVAHLNVLQKIARTMSGNVRDDTYEDMAAYSAIAGECAQPTETINLATFNEGPAMHTIRLDGDFDECVNCGGRWHRGDMPKNEVCPQTFLKKD